MMRVRFVYSIDFKEEPTFSPIPAYWFDLTNLSHKASPIAIIVPRQHPYLEAIIDRFDAEIEMFSINKPE